MTPEITCEACRARLPEYVNGRLTPDERASVERHLATCATCQAEAQTWRIIAGVVRGVESTTSPEVPLAASLAQVRARIASHDQVVTPKGSAIMSDTVMSAPPSPPRISRRTYPIVAATLLIALIGGFFYFTHTTSPTMGPAPATCDATHSGAGLTKKDSLSAIDMTSATTGWGVGLTYDPAHSNDPRSLIARYSNCQWQHFGASTPDVVFVALSMGAADDGWAVGLQKVAKPSGANALANGILVHYTHGGWQSVSLPSILPQPGIFEQVRMVSADEGWFIYDSLQQGQRGFLLVHYVRGVWQVTANMSKVSMVQVTAVAPADCLILERNPDQTSIVAHYQQGTWTTWQPPTNVTMTGVLLVTPTEGYTLGYILANDASVQSSYLARFDGRTWHSVAGPTIEGQYQDLNGLAGVPGQLWIAGSAMNTQLPPLVWQGTPGAWHALTVPAPGTPFGSNGQITQIDPVAPTDAWAIVNQSVQLTSTLSLLRGVLWHEQNGQWVDVQS